MSTIRRKQIKREEVLGEVGMATVDSSFEGEQAE